VVDARSAIAALSKLERIGRREQLNRRTGKTEARFEFVGVEELIELESVFDRSEVWWEFFVAYEPMERRRQLIPQKSHLRAFSVGRERVRLRRERASHKRSR